MPEGVPIVLLIGQSNMRNPELPLAAAENVALKGGIVVHYAISGSPLSADLDTGPGDWSGAGGPEDGEHLDQLLLRLDALLTPGSPAYIEGSYLAGAIWVQGEADAANGDSSGDYQDNLSELREVLVEDYGDHDWAVAALSGDVWEFRDVGLNREPFWMTVREAQLELGDEDGFHTVDTEALADELGFTTEEAFRDDFVHYSPEFAKQLGTRLAEQFDFQGNAKLVVGTAGKDSITIEGDGIQQVFGSSGHDQVDFSGLNKGIKLTAYARGLAAVEEVGRGANLHVNLVDVERVIGTDYDDKIRLNITTRDVRTGGGADRVVGGDSHDTIRLGDGDDIATGGAGNDALIGENGNDRLVGQAGNDRLYGGNGHDVIQAGAGDDLIIGGRGDDVIRPHQGDDTLLYQRGDNGADTVYNFSGKHDVLSFEGTGISIDDLFLSVEESDLRIQIQMDDIQADIRLVNRAWYMPDDDDEKSLDWLVF